MKNTYTIALTLLILLNTSASYSQIDKKDFPADAKLRDCESSNQSTSAECRELAAIDWDKDLNKYYKLVMDKLTAEEKIKLREAQRKWIVYRDNEDAFCQTLISTRKGTYWTLLAATRKLRVVRSRTIELMDYYNTLIAK